MNNETTTNNEMLSNDEIISTLNGLIETCKDGQEGFETSAQSVKNEDLQATFKEFSGQRAGFAGELSSLVSALGGDPESSGTLAGTLHRGWLNLKAAVTGGDEAAILDECERGEDGAKDAYRAALEKALPGDIAHIVQRQNAAILEAHRKIKSLRDNANNMSNTAKAS
jgi:uncharacterized protein (TIGR02284 family)